VSGVFMLDFIIISITVAVPTSYLSLI